MLFQNKKIIFIVNEASFFVSHRLAIAKTILGEGGEVTLAARDIIPPKIISELGIRYYSIDFSRKGIDPFTELKTLYQILSLFRLVQPDVVHLITIKPYLYGGIAARLLRIKSVVSAVAGLGMLFSSNQVKYKILRLLLIPFYSLAFGHSNQKVIFQNRYDYEVLAKWRLLKKSQSDFIPGSGVDLNLCSLRSEPKGVPVVSLAARLLVDKGIEVFVQAARILKLRNCTVRFWLIGEPDLGNSSSVTHDQLKCWEQDEIVELLGYRENIPELFSKSNIVVLPSFYGEGLPKVLVEAAACGRAVITTDHPGCRDAIVPNETGILVPIRNAEALADAIEDLINNPDKRQKLGQAGRSLAERQFGIENIVDAHMLIYEGLLKNAELTK